jgi:HEPN domain-containing protein
LNLSAIEADRKRSKDELAKSDWQSFVMNADYSYFVARVLLAQDVNLYGLFCAHQCVEVYLKALLRSVDAELPQHHKLVALLNAARLVEKNSTGFVHSIHAETICLRFDPFYEIARYPVQISRPKDGKWLWVSGSDEKFLDYFVHRMRKSLPPDTGARDLLTNGEHFYLDLVREHHPLLFKIFKNNNLNFAQ